MKHLVPTLNTPLDEVCAVGMWARLSQESLADLIPYCSDPRSNGHEIMMSFKRPDLLRFIKEAKSRASDFGENDHPVLDLLANIGLCWRDLSNCPRNFSVELCYQSGVTPKDGLLYICGGERSLMMAA